MFYKQSVIALNNGRYENQLIVLSTLPEYIHKICMALTAHHCRVLKFALSEFDYTTSANVAICTRKPKSSGNAFSEACLARVDHCVLHVTNSLRFLAA